MTGMPFCISVVCVGKDNDEFAGAIGHYLRLIGPYTRLHVDLVKPVSASAGSVKSMEGERLLKRSPPGAWAVALEAGGRQYDSRGFAAWMGHRRQQGTGLVFFIGGAYGLSDEVVGASRETISLSPLTFSHRLCMAVFLEQVYRAFTILNNHPYHK